jgi:hypothetical protein
VRVPRPFNPLDKINLGKSVAEALLESDVVKLEVLTPFAGAGIYAIYYTGRHALYNRIAARNRRGRFAVPIYVGKAIPPGGRKGGELSANPGQVLYRRLAEHAESINLVENLDLEDFQCRVLVVDDIWIPLGESLLIAKFSPIWNKVIDGFGNHDPGKGRYEGKRPRWDVLHPGRPWAERCKQRDESKAQIEAEVRQYLAGTSIPATPTMFDDSQSMPEDR